MKTVHCQECEELFEAKGEEIICRGCVDKILSKSSRITRDWVYVCSNCERGFSREYKDKKCPVCRVGKCKSLLNKVTTTVVSKTATEWVPAGIGAVIGTYFFPGVGTFAGFAVGKLFSWWKKR
jgi:DNA-directed RNA polymerase subunit RPC12/RpoP